MTSIDADDDCLHLLLEAWYLDDGVLAGERSAVLRALQLIEELGPHLGLNLNFSKCEVCLVGGGGGGGGQLPISTSSEIIIAPQPGHSRGAHWGLCTLCSIYSGKVRDFQGFA